jgi:RNA polymerase sigma-70 factor (ECF subfamily)
VPTNESTEALVERALRGEPDALTALVRRYLRPAYSVALGIVRRPTDAEDVAQDALLIAVERLETCRDHEAFGAWMLQIVRNQARNWLARRRLRDVPAGEAPERPGDGPAPDTAAFRSRLLEALDVLSETEREVVLLHDLEGWTHPEIAEALGISVVMSRQLLFQSRRKLRAELREDVPDA